MTITVLNIVAGPFPATGAEQTIPFDYKVFTPSEVEVVTGVGSSQVTVDPSLYTVNRNIALDGQVLEGGSIVLSAGAVTAGLSIRAIAKPKLTQDQVYSDTSSRLKNLNEGLDRAALRAQRAAYDGAQEGASAELIQQAIEAGTAAGEAAGASAAEAGLAALTEDVDAAAQEAANALTGANAAIALTNTAAELRQATYVNLLDVVPQSLWAALKTPASDPTDMTPYILAAAARLPNGGVIRCDGLFLRIRTRCVLPTNVFLWGGDACPDEYLPWGPGSYTLVAPQLLYDEETDYGGGVLGPVLRVGIGSSGYSGFTVRPYTFTPMYSSKASFMIAQAAHFKKKFSNHIGPGGNVHHNLYLGPFMGHDAYNIERPTVMHNKGDCVTLINAQTITDWGGIQNNHKWPFSSAHQPWSDAETGRRAGPSHTMYDLFDWGQLFRPLAYNGREGIDVRNCDNTSIMHFGIDGPAPDARFGGSMPDSWYTANPATGLKYTGSIRRASAVDGMISSQTIAVSVDLSYTLPVSNPSIYGPQYSDDIHHTNIRIGATRDYAYDFIRGNFTTVNSNSHVNYLAGSIYTHVRIGLSFGKLSFIGHTFENGLDFNALPVKLREVQLVACNFKTMTTQVAYTQQLQGVLYVRGDDTTNAGKNKASVIIENRSGTTTGTATGQAWGLTVKDDGTLCISDISDSEDLVIFDPVSNNETHNTSRFFGNAVVGDGYWFGAKGGSEPTNLALGFTVSALGVISNVFARGPQGSRSLLYETINGDIAGTTATFTAADFGSKRRTANTAATTLTLPNTAPVGAWIDIIQGSTGQVTMAVAAGGTVVGYPGVKSAGFNATIRATCHNNGSGTAAAWYISGAAAA